MVFVFPLWLLSFAVCTLAATSTADSEPLQKVLPGSRSLLGHRREGHECWVYSPFDSSDFALRAGPTVAGDRSGNHLQAGQAFAVSATVVGADGVHYLELSDGSGWAFDVDPAFQRTDSKHSSAHHAGHHLSRRRERDHGCLPSHHHSEKRKRHGWKLPRLAFGSAVRKVFRHERLWRYNPVNGASIAIRSEPSIAGARTEHFMVPGTNFEVDRETQGNDGVRFLRLSDGTGWVFEEDPAKGTMCEPASASSPQQEHAMFFKVGDRRLLQMN